MRYLAPALAGVLTCLLLGAATASAHGPNASFAYEPASPEPGEHVTFRATATPTHGGAVPVPLRLSWDLDDDGQFDDAQDAVAGRAFSVARSSAISGTST
jgi:hypothetical protein